MLNKQNAFPARLLFVSSRESASIFEIANEEIARIDMEDGVLALGNHVCVISSKNVRKSSTKRLDFGNQFIPVTAHILDLTYDMNYMVQVMK